MSKPVKYRIREGVAIVTLAKPPNNALTPEVRSELWDIFGRLVTDTRVTSVMLSAEGDYFSVGPDVREAGEGEGAPTLAEVCERIESCPRPVVAALHGLTLGGGAELALAAHWRLADPDSRLGFPEVALGLVCGAGGSQRLPRIVGADAALRLLLSGRPIAADAARKLGLVDGIVVGHLPTGTHTYAKSIAARGTAPRPTRARRSGLSDGVAFTEAVAHHRAAQAASALIAPARMIDCVEAALLLPFPSGLMFEAAARADCRADPQSVALTHVFLSERRISTRLLSSTEGRRTVAEPEGAQIVGRLQHVLGQTVTALSGQGVSAATIDAAMVDYGFAKGAFGGTEPGAGREGAEVVPRIVAALMAAGARLVETGAVSRPGDVDVLAVYGLGFPRHRGGPLRAAQSLGLLRMKRLMEGWAEESALWSPPRLLTEAIKFSAGFDQLSEGQPAA
ncbi:enoyl-CoA hydratase-related protein [Roseisalinus antarcticus]|nr:enoyl-CoA hydratase-related protein [Roseisalinus antarcticus]